MADDNVSQNASLGGSLHQYNLGGLSLNAVNLAHSTINFKASSPNDSLQPWTVPRDVSPLFTGREDVLGRLARAFSPRLPDDPESQRRVVIHGLGGTGKSEVCVKFVHDVRDNYWGIFWIDCTTAETASKGFTTIGQLCGLTNPDMASARAWLSSTKKSWLLILDNVDDPATDLRAYQPSGQRGDIVVTTRNSTLSKPTDVMCERLDQLPADTATGLLLKCCTADDSPSNRQLALNVVEAVSCHTLAIRTAGAYIREGYCSLAQYSSVLIDSNMGALQFEDHEEPSNYRSVHRTLEVSIKALDRQRLKGDQRASDALDLLEVYPFIAKEGPMQLMLSNVYDAARKIMDVPIPQRADFDSIYRPHMSSCLMLNPARLRQANSLLRSFSLIDYSSNTEIVSFHPLVHAWANARLTGDSRRKGLLRTCATLAVAVCCTEEYSPLPFPRADHIEAFMTHDLHSLCQETPAWITAPLLMKIVTSWIAQDAVLVHAKLQKFHEISSLQDKMIKCCFKTEVLRHKNPLVRLLVRSKGLSYEDKWPSELRYSIESFTISQNHLEWLVAFAKGDDNTLLRLSQAQVAAMKSAYGKLDLRYLNATLTLGLAYLRNNLNNEAMETISSLVESVPNALEMPGCLILLAQAYLRDSQYARAIGLLEPVLGPPDAPGIMERNTRATLRLFLGRAYAGLGRTQDAIDSLEFCIVTTPPWADSAGFLNEALEDLMAVYVDTEQYSNIIERLEPIFGPGQIDAGFHELARGEINLCEALAFAYWSTGAVEKAVALLKLVVERTRQLDGSDSPETVSRAATLQTWEEFDASESNAQEATTDADCSAGAQTADE